jgi:hypothetical protein
MKSGKSGTNHLDLEEKEIVITALGMLGSVNLSKSRMKN